jgi:hypothetical protein
MLDGKNVVNISKMLDGKMWTWDKPIVLFSLITQYNAEAHNTHTHSPYEYMYANPIPMSTFEGLSTRQIWRFPKLPLAPHCRRGLVRYYYMHGLGPGPFLSNYTIQQHFLRSIQCIKHSIVRSAEVFKTPHKYLPMILPRLKKPATSPACPDRWIGHEDGLDRSRNNHFCKNVLPFRKKWSLNPQLFTYESLNFLVNCYPQFFKNALALCKHPLESPAVHGFYRRAPKLLKIYLQPIFL